MISPGILPLERCNDLRFFIVVSGRAEQGDMLMMYSNVCDIF